MRVITSKSKNAESFYISKGYVNDKGVSTSVIVRKLGTLKELLPEHGPTRDDVMVWAKEEARLETLKYKQEREEKQIKLTFRADRQLDYDKQVFYRGGYLFLHSVYYQMQIHKICRKLKQKYKFQYDINAILSDLIYARILEPCSKRASYKTALEFLEKPSYKLHDVYRALDVLGAECDLIQAEVYKNSHFMGQRKPLEKKVLSDFGCQKFIYCSDAGLGSESIRDAQVERAQKMLESGKAKRNRKNPNDPARFIGKKAVTKDGEAADIKQYLDEDKIAEEAQYDGLYAVCTDLLDDEVGDILKVSEGRWQIEECFRIMKTDFSARPIYLREENRIKAHFLICFLALTVYRYLEKKLDSKYTCEELLDTLKGMNFAGIQEQGFIPLYRREKITDDLHEACGFRTDYQFITKSKMRTIQKKSKGKE